MAGLIEDQMAPAGPTPGQMPATDPAAAPEDPTGAPAADDGSQAGADPKLNPEALLGQMQLNPKQKQQLMRIVAGGMKVMFDEKSHQMMLQAMQGEGQMPDKLGRAMAGLMGILIRESNNSLPPELIVPAGIVLMAHAADFLQQSQIPLTSPEFGSAVDIFVSTVMRAFKIDPDKVAQVAGGAQAQAEGGTPAPMAPAAPTPAVPAEPVPGGM